MTIEQFLAVITSAGAPGVLALWIWMAEKRARRAELKYDKLVELLLPALVGTQKAMRNVNRVLTGDGEGEDE